MCDFVGKICVDVSIYLKIPKRVVFWGYKYYLRKCENRILPKFDAPANQKIT